MAKILSGIVTSVKQQRTATVQVERKFRHPTYGKVIRRHKKFKVAVPEDIEVQEGQVVTISETRPISKDKKFIVIKNKK